VHVEHSKSQPTDNKLSLKVEWSLSHDLFNFWIISDNKMVKTGQFTTMCKGDNSSKTANIIWLGD